MTKSNLRLVAPITENRTVTPRRPKNADVRSRVGFGAVLIDQKNIPRFKVGKELCERLKKLPQGL